MVIAHHLVWTGYGWWLPNDPRGSMSKEIRNDLLKELGELHYGRKKIQPVPSAIRQFYSEAQSRLKHPLLEFSAREMSVIGESFARTIARNKYTCYACAIMRDHVHVLIRRHRDRAEEMISALQETSCTAMAPLHNGHPIWGGPGWKVFLETPDDIRRTIRYIQNNPPKQRLPAQSWTFVAPYDGWPLGSR